MKGKFQELISDSKPVLVDFYADWCQPCKMQAPILKEVADFFGEKIRIIKINTDKNQEVAMQYRIQSIPTLMLFKNGKVLWQQSGVASKPQLINLLNQHI